jgi:SAM-dependent methyltransferase
MSHDQDFSGDWWERHYQEHGTGQSAPSPHLVTEAADLPVGCALDAGCGAGADARWLAGRGWTVTAVDVSPTVVRTAEELTRSETPDVVRRITWLAADLTAWQAPASYDLVVSQYVHPAVDFGTFVAGLADLVAPGGTLLVAGHDAGHDHGHTDSDVREGSAVGLEAITTVLDDAEWRIDVAERRAVTVAGHHPRHDVVVVARRTS